MLGILGDHAGADIRERSFDVKFFIDGSSISARMLDADEALQSKRRHGHNTSPIGGADIGKRSEIDALMTSMKQCHDGQYNNVNIL